MSIEPERRQGKRDPIVLRVEYRRLNMFFADYTKNISQGGTFVRTDKPLAVGTLFDFSLVVPGLAEPLHLAGKVIWTVNAENATAANPAGMGIEFQYNDEAQKEYVALIVRQAMNRELGPSLTSKLLNSK